MCWVCEGKEGKRVSSIEDWDLYHRILHGRSGGRTWEEVEKEEAEACPVLTKQKIIDGMDDSGSGASRAASKRI